ncbi:MAG TPA: cyclase family protein [Conexibacter sp.]|nr:cyclase family protein [Conexibacter sp.]
MIDASLEIHAEMLHGGRRPTVERPFSLAAGDDYNVTRWTLGAHAGTHVEAPLHTVADGLAIDALPLELFVGPARVLDLSGVEGEDVRAEDLLRAGLGDESRVLLRTRNSETVLHSPEKAEAWVGVAPDAAALLVQRGVRLLGVDYLTVESPAREATFDAHRILNGADVALIESVDLSAVSAGLVELICPPLRLAAEAAPARVVIVPAGGAGAGAGGGAGGLIDISIPLGEATLTWGMAPRRIEVETLAGGDHCNVTRWHLGAHSGTHVDAPQHYSDGSSTATRKATATLHESFAPSCARRRECNWT